MKESVNILVVDDEHSILAVLEQYISREGYNVGTAAGGKEALDYLARERVDLMICDIVMPDMSGYDLLAAAKKDHPDMGVIMMTGFNDGRAVRQALLLGADEYITKPLKGDELSLIIERICWKLRPKWLEAERSGSRPVTAAAGIDPFLGR